MTKTLAGLTAWNITRKKWKVMDVINVTYINFMRKDFVK